MRYRWLTVLFFSVSPILAEDAPQFRGKGGVGVSSEKNLPLEWGSQENLRWKAPLPGQGLSAPVVAEGRAYVTACTGYEQKRLNVLCFDVKNGKKLWERQFAATGTTFCHKKTNMAAPTPVTNGKQVFALFATGDIVCLDQEGNLQWVRSLVGDYPTVGNNVGMASSLTIWNNVLITLMENAGESFGLGINTQTGENQWRVDRPRIINWSTPMVIEAQGQAMVLFQSPSDLSAYDPNNGKKLWTTKEVKSSTIPSMTFGNGFLLVPGDKFTAIRPGKDKAEVVWTSNKLPCQYGSPLYHDGLIYTITAKGVINVAEIESGKFVYSHRLDGNFAASPMYGDGKIYYVNEEGTTTVMLPGKEAKVLATNLLGETVLACPVASNGAIYLRSDQHLYCIGKEKN